MRRPRRLCLVIAGSVALLLAGPAAAQERADPAAGEDTVSVDPVGEAAEGRARAAAPGPAARSFLGAYALLAYDPSTEQLGAVAASAGFSAGSGVPYARSGVGAAAVLGRDAPEAGRAALEALAAGASAEAAARRGASATAGSSEGLRLGVLTPACGSRVVAGEEPLRWSGSRSGTVDGICYVAMGTLLPGSESLGRLIAGFRRTEGALLDRLLGAVTRAESEEDRAARSRSAAVWVLAPDAERGALGRAELRLQVESVQRPADALRFLIRSGRADHRARRASAAVDDGRYEEAIRLADEAIELEPVSARAWLARGRALLYLNRDGEAETALQRMLEVNPYLLHLLGDPGGRTEDGREVRPEVREGMIPYRPRLLRRLDVYRKAFYRQVEFSTDTLSAARPGPAERARERR